MVGTEQLGGQEARPAIWLVGGGVLAAIALVALALFAGSGAYTVTATFQNASQLVPGNEVRMGGVQVGSVKGLDLLDNGQAQVEMEVDDDHSPLDDGTRAVIRQTSLSGIANRFVDLQLPGGSAGGEIADGGAIPSEDTVAAVELDALFNTLDEPTREALQKFFEGSATMFEGREKEAREGYRYLGPALSSGRRLFKELATDTLLLDRFVVDSARLVTAAADRRDDLAGLVPNLSETTRAASADQGALAESLDRLPDFMRRANTTFVNLRGALDDVDPLVSASKPAAKRLKRFLPQLRGFATDAGPAVRDLSRTIRDPGPDDDLVELLRTFPALTDIAVDSAERNGATRPGAFPVTADALEKAAPLIAFGRPYTPDLFGWFDDFSQTGSYDATGGFSRTQVYLNLFSVTSPGAPTVVAPQDRAANFAAIAKTKQFKRCPGHSEAAAADGSNVYSAEQAAAFDCDPAHRAVGP
ncbi:MAG TPA: MlaD family protein [Thermoleophilaceae bacterium]|nr:MlaD family protein [Thermoleophilaceae bacterium]